MPIIFPITVIEKIVEKIVEKTVYVVADLYAKISITYRYIQNAVLPSVNILAQTITSIGKVFIPPFIAAYYLVHSYMQNVQRSIFPQPNILAQTITSIRIVFLPPYYKKITSLAYSFIQNQVKPTVNFILGTTQLLLGRSVTDVKKPYPTHQLVSNPAKPSPTAVTQFNTSVGVRKTP
jgi:hypothetical protein